MKYPGTLKFAVVCPMGTVSLNSKKRPGNTQSVKVLLASSELDFYAHTIIHPLYYDSGGTNRRTGLLIEVLRRT